MAKWMITFSVVLDNSQSSEKSLSSARDALDRAKDLVRGNSPRVDIDVTEERVISKHFYTEGNSSLLKERDARDRVDDDWK